MLNRPSLNALAGIALILGAAGAAAQPVDAALNEAKRRIACGAGIPVSAQYLPGGFLKITCRASNSQASSESLPETMQGTGLGTTAGIAVSVTSVVLLVLTGDDETGTTTTTTTTTGGN